MTSLRDLIDAVAANGTTVPAEVAAFVALEVAERISDRPTRVAPVFVEVSGEGEVTVASTSHASVTDAVRSVGRILSEMVSGEGGAAPPGLEEVVRRTANGGADAYVDLATLRADLEAYLVPLNRGAARRVLARYLRDVLREPGDAPPDGLPDDDRPDRTQDGLDLEVLEAEAARPPDPLDDLLDDLTSPPTQVGAPVSVHERETTPSDDEPPRETVPVPDVGSLLDDLEVPGPSAQATTSLADTDLGLDGVLQDLPTVPRISEPPPAPPLGRSEPAAVPPSYASAPPAPAPIVIAATSQTRSPSGVSAPLVLPDIAEPRARRGFGVLLVTVVLLVGALIAVLYQARPELFGGSPARASTRRSPETSEPAPSIEYGALSVTSEPPGAEVLLFVGRGPVEVTHLPVGVAHEFVAIADDGRVSRGLVPADAPFVARRDGPDPVSTELAIQLPLGEAAANAAWPGTNLPPGAPPEGTGQLGTVRVVTNPLGAKVFLLVGFTPTAPISNLRLDEAYELLVVKEGHARERVVVGRSDWHKVEGSDDFVHQASVTLHAEEAPPPERHRRRRRHHR